MTTTQIVWHKKNEQFDPIFNIITETHSSHKVILGLTVDNKFFLDDHINNICKIVNKKLYAFSRINPYIK